MSKPVRRDILFPTESARTPAHDLFYAINEPTSVQKLRMPPLDASEIERTMDAARKARASLSEPPRGFMLYLTDGRVVATKVIGTDALDYAIVGRHTFCDVRLLGDPRVALRQLLVRPAPANPGKGNVPRPVLELMSLGARLPLVSADGRLASGLRTSGEFILRLGAYLMVGLAPGEGPRFRANAGYRDDPRIAQPEGEGSQDQSGAFPIHSEFHPYRHEHGLTRVANLPVAPKDAVGRIVLQCAHERADAWVTQKALYNGILIGRYTDRCHTPALSAILRKQISRTHLLLVGKADSPIAYDLATVNGTYTAQGRIRARELGPEAGSIQLGRPPGVHVRWERA